MRRDSSSSCGWMSPRSISAIPASGAGSAFLGLLSRRAAIPISIGRNRLRHQIEEDRLFAARLDHAAKLFDDEIAPREEGPYFVLRERAIDGRGHRLDRQPLQGAP